MALQADLGFALWGKHSSAFDSSSHKNKHGHSDAAMSLPESHRTGHLNGQSGMGVVFIAQGYLLQCAS